MISNGPCMAVDALVRRHLAAPTNPITTFKCVYLPLLRKTLGPLHQHLCTQEAGAWRVGRGLTKLRDIDESLAMDQPDRKRVSMMIKKEVSIVPFGAPELPKKARGIQFCTNLRTAYEHAVEQYSFGHALAQATQSEITVDGVGFTIVYTAEMPPADIAEFATESEGLRARYPCSFLDERDGKNWDANVQVAHREAIAEFYGTIDPILEKIARASIRVKGKYGSAGVQVTYEINGTVKSGHWDTSSGNAALNLEVTVQAIISLPDRMKPVRVRGLVMGDDLLLWLYFPAAVDAKGYVDAINKAETALGIHPVRGVFADVRCVSFCSNTFYTTSQGKLAMVPKLGRTFAKLFWTVTPLAGRDPARLASTIAHAFYPVYLGYHPMREFLRHHMGVPPLDAQDVVSSQLPYLCRSGLPTWEGVQWAEGNLVKYGILPGTLDDIRTLLLGRAGGLHHPAIDMMIQQDQSDPCDRRGCLAC